MRNHNICINVHMQVNILDKCKINKKSNKLQNEKLNIKIIPSHVYTLLLMTAPTNLPKKKLT